MKNLKISVSDIERLPDVAKNILRFSEEKKVFAFYAEMGAGKTTLIKEFCRQLGSQDNFSSPTYSIVNEYFISSSPVRKVYHMDLFRLKDLEEVLNVGVEEYLNSTEYCFIEWPELIESLLPEDVVKIYIKCDGNIRNLSIFINH